MQNYAKSVATEILRQLGGNRFIVMTGAKSFSYFDENGECGLTFRLSLIHISEPTRLQRHYLVCRLLLEKKKKKEISKKKI